MLEAVIAAVDGYLKAAPKRKGPGSVTSPGPGASGGPPVTRQPAPQQDAGTTGRLLGPRPGAVGELPPPMIRPDFPGGQPGFTFGPSQTVGQQPTANTNPPALNVRPLAPHEVPYQPSGQYGPALGTPPPGAPPSGPVRQRPPQSGSSLPIDPSSVAGEEDPWINRRAHQMKPGSPFYWHPPLITKKQLAEQGTGPPQQESVTIRDVDPNDPTQGGSGNPEHGHPTPGGGQEQDNPSQAQTGGLTAEQLAARLGIAQPVSRGAQNVHGTYPYDPEGHGPTLKFMHENLMDQMRLLKQQHPGFFQRTTGNQVVPVDLSSHFDSGEPMSFDETVAAWLALHGEPRVPPTASEQRAAEAAARARARFQQQQQGGGRAPSTRGGGGGGTPPLVPGQIPNLQQLQQLNQGVVGRPPSTTTHTRAPRTATPRAKRGSAKAFEGIIAAMKAEPSPEQHPLYGDALPATPAKKPVHHRTGYLDSWGNWHAPPHGHVAYRHGRIPYFVADAAPKRAPRTKKTTSSTPDTSTGGSGGGGGHPGWGPVIPD